MNINEISSKYNHYLSDEPTTETTNGITDLFPDKVETENESLREKEVSIPSETDKEDYNISVKSGSLELFASEKGSEILILLLNNENFYDK